MQNTVSVKIHRIRAGAAGTVLAVPLFSCLARYGSGGLFIARLSHALLRYCLSQTVSISKSLGLVEVDCLYFVSSLVYKRSKLVYVGLAHARPIISRRGLPVYLLDV